MNDEILEENKITNSPKKKSYTITYILWALFGVIGGHRFYLGKWFTGLLYLFSFGLFFYGWLFDLIWLFFMVKNHNQPQQEEEKYFLKKLTITPELAPWASIQRKNFFVNLLNSIDGIFRTIIFIIFPVFTAFFAYFFDAFELLAFLVIVLFMTGYIGSIKKGLGSIEDFFSKNKHLSRIPLLPEILDRFKEFYDFYYEYKPSNPLSYILYPIFGLISLTYSKKSRKEFGLFVQLIVLIMIALALENLVNFDDKFLPYLEPLDVIGLIILTTVVTFITIPVFLMPTISSSFYLKLSGRNTLNRWLATLGIVLGIGTYYFAINDPDMAPVMAEHRLEAKAKKENFQNDFYDTNQMILNHYIKKAVWEKEGIAYVMKDNNLTKKYRNHIQSIIHKEEAKALIILKLETQNHAALAVKYTSDNFLLYIIDKDKRIYSHWNALPIELQNQFILKQDYHADTPEENIPVFVLDQYWLMGDYIDSLKQ